MEISQAVFGYGSDDPQDLLTECEVEDILRGVFAANDLRGQKVLMIIPDSTRTMPLPLFFRVIHKLLKGIVKKLDLIIALGTHMPMSDEAIYAHLGITEQEYKDKYSDVFFYNHAWDDPSIFIKIGEIDHTEIQRLTFGTVDETIPVEINRIILNYDLLVVCGPVFPHEIAGYSGGSKYFFPGLGAPAFINITHWIAAMNTCYATIGFKDAPARALLERAAGWLPKPYLYCCPVVRKEGIYGLFAGYPHETWLKAVDLSSQIHVRYEKHRYKKVLSVMPRLYDDIWTAAKGMYKLEPVVEDGGELIIYAPHIDTLSYVHGKTLEILGYHCRDYFIKQWDKFKDVPWGLLAHSTHGTGLGTFEDGIEKKRVRVSLATAIPEAYCKKINIGYIDPKTIDIKDFENREDEGILCVPYAGETLYRLESERQV